MAGVQEVTIVGTCPRCGGRSRSVAAMYHAETELWRKAGHFSAAGAGVGPGGFGVGAGGGSYSERGEIGTRRAITFAPPAPFDLGGSALFTLGVGGALMMAVAPSVFQSMTQALFEDGTAPAPQEPLVGLALALSSMSGYLGPVAGLLIFVLTCYGSMKSEQEQARLNTEVLPKLVTRYGELRYCEHCNVLHDHRGRSEVGSKDGFDRMMRQRG